jgi:amidase
MGLGSDAAGSVRLPAAFCGIASIKPTSRRLPRQGHFPAAGGWIEALWQIGPMTRWVEDLVAMMPVLLGQPFELASLDGLRVAFYTDNGIAVADPEVTGVVHAAAQAMKAEEARPACLDASYDLEMKLIGPDGGDSLREYLEFLGSKRAHPLLRGWLDKLQAYRTDLHGFQGYWAEWDQYRAAMCEFLRRFDVILCPAYPHPALPHGASIEDENFRGFSHTMAFNVAGWPAAVVRCGESETGLPIAVQVAAGPGREDQALAVALRLEEVFGGWKRSAILAV